jgi:D-alanine transaminase
VSGSAAAPAVFYLNGAYLPPEQACLSPLDRGFLFGDGVYEVIPSYGGTLFLLDAHLERLRNSLAAIALPDPMPGSGWKDMLYRLLALNPGADRGVYLQVTRGVAPRDHLFPATSAATVFAMVNPIKPIAPDAAERGVAAITLPDQRWGRCDIKAVTLLANVLARQTASERGAVEAILLRDGAVTEGAASNAFVVHDGVVRTPPLGDAILPGVTRRFVLELFGKSPRTVAEAAVSEAELRSADEIWLTSSTKEVVPVTRLDDRPVGDGRPGRVWREITEAYQAAKREAVEHARRSSRHD